MPDLRRIPSSSAFVLQGDKPANTAVQTYPLDIEYGFAGEVGVLIGDMGLIETYLPELLAKITDMSKDDASITLGTLTLAGRISLVRRLVLRRKQSQLRTDVMVLVGKLGRAKELRNKSPMLDIRPGSRAPVIASAAAKFFRACPSTAVNLPALEVLCGGSLLGTATSAFQLRDFRVEPGQLACQACILR
jgi:hypothetical protein